MHSQSRNSHFMESWSNKVRRQRARRALERQLEYQKEKAETMDGNDTEFLHGVFVRACAIRQKLSEIKAIPEDARVLEVGSGAHGLIFAFGGGFGVGIDPLAVEYKKLFPKWQENSQTIAAIGEQLPFAGGAFDVVLSDNVVDHAEDPVKIIEELTRVLKPGGLLFFTVNIHHPFYDLVSRAHGIWNGLGIQFEISPFADHTVHFTEKQVREIFGRLPLDKMQVRSTVAETKNEYRILKAENAEQRLKKIFYKNALIEIIAVRS